MNAQHQRVKKCLLLSLVLLASALIPAFADVVKVTPLGSHSGEFCSRDRALVFEGPMEHVYFMMLAVLWRGLMTHD